MCCSSSESIPSRPRCARAFISLGSIFLLSGCISMQTPEKFLVIARGTEELKAISPEEAKIWVREFEDSDKGDFDFWSEALRTDLVKNRGYTLIEENEVEDDDGLRGLELLFEMTVQGVPYRYSITLFVIEGFWFFSNAIRVAEFMAPKDAFDGYLADVRKAVKTID